MLHLSTRWFSISIVIIVIIFIFSTVLVFDQEKGKGNQSQRRTRKRRRRKERSESGRVRSKKKKNDANVVLGSHGIHRDILHVPLPYETVLRIRRIQVMVAALGLTIDDDDDEKVKCREGGREHAIDDWISECDILEREQFGQEEEGDEEGCDSRKNNKHNSSSKKKNNKNNNKTNKRRVSSSSSSSSPASVIPLDPTTAKGPFIFLKVGSGVFNQFQMLWPMFIFARELNATVLIGSGLSRGSFLEELPQYHPIPQSLLWDVAYMQQYWKKRGVEVYFSNFEPLLRKLLLPTEDERQQQQLQEEGRNVSVHGMLTNPLRTRPHVFKPALNFYESSGLDRRDEMWFGDKQWESDFQEIVMFREQLWNIKQGIIQIKRPTYLTTKTKIRSVVEKEMNAKMTPETIVFMPAEFVYGAFAVDPNDQKTRKLAREACLSIHISPRLLEMGCNVWNTVREQAGSAMVIGVHLRIENDAQVWWSDFSAATQLYSERITAAYFSEKKKNNHERHGIYGYLAYGELPPDREDQVIRWADSFFKRWTTKQKVMDEINSRREKLPQIKESKEQLRLKAEKQNRMNNRTVPYEYRGYGEHIVDIINANTMDSDEIDVEQHSDAMALVDAYVLTQCDLFVGHQLSSFSFTVEQWRTSKKLPSFYLNPNQPPPPPFFEAW